MGVLRQPPYNKEMRYAQGVMIIAEQRKAKSGKFHLRSSVKESVWQINSARKSPPF